nr:MAG TPA: hypothetical protein [Caudoviricetes sp.]
MEVTTIGGYIYSYNYQNPNKYAHLGRFFYVLKLPIQPLLNTFKRYPPSKAQKHPLKKLGMQLGTQLGTQLRIF